jgi:hypothetical protein
MNLINDRKKKAPGSTIASLLEASDGNVGSAEASVDESEAIVGAVSNIDLGSSQLHYEGKVDNDEEEGWD